MNGTFNFLIHYGILGMKWGIRRYQNLDGTLTEAGKKRAKYRNRHIQATSTKSDVDNIIKSLNKDDKNKVLAGDNQYLTEEQSSTVVKRFLKYEGNTPISFFDILEDEKSLNIALATRSGNKYRNKGYSSDLAKKGMKWIEKNKNNLPFEEVIWGVRTDNKSSIHIAEKNGFLLDPNSYSDDKSWVNYVKKIK